MNIPNSLTVARVALIPVFVGVFYLPYWWVHLASAAIFGLAALTDLLDGYLARRLGQTSAFGAFLDPVADKLMVAVALVLLVQAHPTPWLALPAAIIIGREVAISALREWMAELGQRSAVAVAFVGKVKTTAQMVAILLMLLAGRAGEWVLWEWLYKLGFAMLYVAAILTLWSMVTYLRAVWPVLLAEEGPSAGGSQLDSADAGPKISGSSTRE